MVIKHSNLPIDERIALIDLSKELSDPKPSLLQTHHYPTKSPHQVYQAIE
jgi:hypothetical protein